MDCLVKKWLWAGIEPNNLSNINPIRLTNIIALVCFAMLMLQLPFHYFYWQEGGKVEILIILCHIGAIILVPILSAYHQITSARSCLIITFCSFILSSTIYLGNNSNMHQLLILGIFILPFTFPENKKHISIASTLTFSLLFILWDTQWLNLQTTGIDNNYQSQLAQLNSFLLIFLSLFSSYLILRNTQVSWQKLAQEQKRSESLLLNILPYPVANKLKQDNQPVADRFENATILFADIQGFSELSQTLEPETLLNLLNDVFSAFDKICKIYSLEKIKTIGDEYMAVCGVPTEVKNHARLTCLCALEMRKVFNEICLLHGIHAGLRIGVNSGSVVAGVIGKDKFCYDLWGEAVNLASRMESHGVNDKVQVSHNTYQLVADDFHFESRDTIDIKGMGQIPCYLLVGLKTHDTTRH